MQNNFHLLKCQLETSAVAFTCYISGKLRVIILGERGMPIYTCVMLRNKEHAQGRERGGHNINSDI